MSEAFEAALNNPHKQPRVIVRHYHDKAKLNFTELTSHADCKTDAGVVRIDSVVRAKDITGFLQILYPDKNRSDIGRLTLKYDDLNDAVTDFLNALYDSGEDIFDRQVEIYFGFKGFASEDYVKLQTQIVDSAVAYHEGVYTIRCADITRYTDEQVFTETKTRLVRSLRETDTTILVEDVTPIDGADSGFTHGVEQGASFDVGTNQTIVAFTIGDERMWCLESDVIETAATTATGWSVTGSDISFERETGAIRSTSTDLSGAPVGQWITVSGVTANATFFKVVSTSANEVVVESFLAEEAVGQLITITGYSDLAQAVPRFQNVNRTDFKTTPEAHEVPTDPNSQKPIIARLWYVQMPAAKLVLAVLTGQLYGQAGMMPDGSHLGIDPSLVDIQSLINSTADKWNPSDDTKGVIANFRNLKKTNAKLFLESRVYPMLRIYPYIDEDGAYGFRKIKTITKTTTPEVYIDESEIVKLGPLKKDANLLVNDVRVEWDHDYHTGENPWITWFPNTSSWSKFKRSKLKTISLDGLTSEHFSSDVVKGLINYFHLMHSAPPYTLSATLKFKHFNRRPGQIIQFVSPSTKDYTAGSYLDRSFLILSVKPRIRDGVVDVTLMGTSEFVEPLTSLGSAYHITDAHYTVIGTELSTVVPIVNNVVQAGTHTLVGGATLNDGVYYHDGPLWTGSDVTFDISDNVFVRVRGFFTDDAHWNGAGSGLAGAAPRASTLEADGITANVKGNPGLSGGYGITQAMGGFGQKPWVINGSVIKGKFSLAPSTEAKVYPSKDASNLISIWDGDSLSILGYDLRGASGGSGGNVYAPDLGIVDTPGSHGGQGGAGLAINSRGYSGNATYNLSGANGQVGSKAYDAETDRYYWSGSGCGGYGGGLHIYIDGSYPLPQGVKERFTANKGETPKPPSAVGWPAMKIPPDVFAQWDKSYYAISSGLPIPTTNTNESNLEISHVLNNAPDNREGRPETQSIAAPTFDSLVSGDAAMDPADKDGTRQTKFKGTLTPPDDPYYDGAEVQFRQSTETAYTRRSALVLAGTNEFKENAAHNIGYFVRIRAWNKYKKKSPWVELFILADGKGAPPGNVQSITTSSKIAGVQLNITPPGDDDILHYRVWRSLSNNKAFADIVARPTDTNPVIPLTVGVTEYIWVDVVDRSGNISEQSYPVSATAGLAVSAAAVDYLGDLVGTPTVLADINASEGAHLAGIEAGATNTTNTNQLTDGAQLGQTASYALVTGPKPPSNADNTASNVALNTQNVGSTAAATVESQAASGSTFTSSDAGLLAYVNQADWNDDIANRPLEENLLNSNDAVVLGFNPIFDWIDGAVRPRNWGAWAINPTHEKTNVRIGKSAPRFITDGLTNAGIARAHTFSSPMPADTVFRGSYDYRLVSDGIGYGNAGLLIDIGYGGAGAYSRHNVTLNERVSDGAWRTRQFAVRAAAGQTIDFIRVYVMGSWNGFGGFSQMDITFDRFQFEMIQSEFDNTQQVWSDVNDPGDGSRPADHADVTLAAIEAGLTVLSGGLVLGGDGLGGSASLRMGDAAGYRDGAGIWLGTETQAGLVKANMHVGDPALEQGFSYDPFSAKFDVWKNTELRGADAYNNSAIYHRALANSLDQWDLLTSGTSTVSVGGGVLRLQNGTAAGDYALASFGSSHALSAYTWDKPRSFKVIAEPYYSASLDHEIVSGVPGIVYAGNSPRMGFKMTGGNIYAVVANAAGETVSASLSAWVSTQKYALEVIYNATSVEFYIDGDLKTTISTNIPTGLSYAHFALRVALKTNTASPAYTFRIGEWAFLQESD